MKQKKNLLIITAAVFAGIIVVWSFTSIQGSQRTYEVQPKITMPEYRTDSIRVLDAYERLMERYMDLVEKNLKDIDIDIKKTTVQIDSIDAKLTLLCDRTARIEKALGIEQPKEATPKPLVGRDAGRDKQMRQEGRN
jgi:Na+/phosphate symporter